MTYSPKIVGKMADFESLTLCISPQIQIKSRKELLAKIKSYGIDGKILNVIESQYLGNVACVKVGDFLSESFKMLIGVKQGDPPIS